MVRNTAGLCLVCDSWKAKGCTARDISTREGRYLYDIIQSVWHNIILTCQHTFKPKDHAEKVQISNSRYLNMFAFNIDFISKFEPVLNGSCIENHFLMPIFAKVVFKEKCSFHCGLASILGMWGRIFHPCTNDDGYSKKLANKVLLQADNYSIHKCIGLMIRKWCIFLTLSQVFFLVYSDLSVRLRHWQCWSSFIINIYPFMTTLYPFMLFRDFVFT